MLFCRYNNLFIYIYLQIKIKLDKNPVMTPNSTSIYIIYTTCRITIHYNNFVTTSRTVDPHNFVVINNLVSGVVYIAAVLQKTSR